MMYLEDFEEVAALKKRREIFGKLHAAAESGSVTGFKAYLQGESIDVFSIIPAQPVRDAIMAECRKEIDKITTQLDQLGVNTAPKLRRAG